MVKKAKNSIKKIPKHYGLIVLAFCVAVSAALVLPWIIAREVYLAETKNVRESSENIVINTVGAPTDLVNTLLAEKSGCEPTLPKNVSYIVRSTDRFALTHFGCGLDAYMYYKKVNGEWKSLSPTNNFIGRVPLCSHLKEHAIPSDFQAFCMSDQSPEGKNPAIMANPVR